MPNISERDYRRMKDSFDPAVARFLAEVAASGNTVTYGQLSEKFGRSPRGWGNVLGGIAIRCHDAGLPLLPVIVVNAATRLPSVDAVLYADLGVSLDAMREEQSRCLAFDWSGTTLGARPSAS